MSLLLRTRNTGKGLGGLFQDWMPPLRNTPEFWSQPPKPHSFRGVKSKLVASQVALTQPVSANSAVLLVPRGSAELMPGDFRSTGSTGSTGSCFSDVYHRALGIRIVLYTSQLWYTKNGLWRYRHTSWQALSLRLGHKVGLTICTTSRDHQRSIEMWYHGI